MNAGTAEENPAVLLPKREGFKDDFLKLRINPVLIEFARRVSILPCVSIHESPTAIVYRPLAFSTLTRHWKTAAVPGGMSKGAFLSVPLLP